MTTHAYAVKVTGAKGGSHHRVIHTTPDKMPGAAMDVAYHVNDKVEYKLMGANPATFVRNNGGRTRRFYTQEQVASYDRGYAGHMAENPGILDFSTQGYLDAEKDRELREDDRRERETD